MKEFVVFFGNEKLVTGIDQTKPLIQDSIKKAGFQIEQVVTGKLSELKPHKAKIAVLAAYGKIIPQRILDEFPLGIINVHPSILPLYRGPTPIEQAMLDGATKTGVSIMRLTAGMDEGPIYKQKTVQLTGQESKAGLAEMLHSLGAEMITDVLPKIVNGSLAPRQQPHPDRATYSSKIDKADGVIDWNKSAEQIEREIRAFAGWPKSQTVIGDKEVIITEAHATPTNIPVNQVGKFEAVGNALMVECGDGALCIDRLKPAGKPEMTAMAFIAGYKNLL